MPHSCGSSSTVVTAAYAILAIAHVVLGAGFTPLLSVASTYLQENVDKHTLGLYLAAFQGASLTQSVHCAFMCGTDSLMQACECWLLLQPAL